MSRLTDFLGGTSEFLLPEKKGESARAMELLLRLGVEYRGAETVALSEKRARRFPGAASGSLSPTQDGAETRDGKERNDREEGEDATEGRALFCVLRRRDEKKAASAFRAAGLSFAVRRRGLPHLFQRYRGRPGLLLGLVLFFFLVFSSENFIFDIRVSGNETLTDGEVLAMLEEDGVKIGGYLPELDLDGICVQFARRHGEVSWISVNMMGTVAEVELREYAAGEDRAPDGSGAHGTPRSLKALVAERDGVVERCEVYGGSALVQPMQVVRRGELLISCVVQTERRFKLEDAAGKVYAKTSRTLTVEVPYEETVKLPKETARRLTGIEILGKTLTFPGREGIFPSSCETIKEKERFVLFGKLPLPVFTVSERLDEQEERTVHREGRALREEADARMALLVEKELADTDILSSDLVYTDTGTGCRLTLTAECLENIAVPLEVKSDLRMLPGEDLT